MFYFRYPVSRNIGTKVLPLAAPMAPRQAAAFPVDQVEYSEEPGSMFYFRYPVDCGDGSDEGEEFLPVATTRPETILGDTAVAVHAEDPRFARFVGRRCRVPLTDRCNASSFHQVLDF